MSGTAFHDDLRLRTVPKLLEHAARIHGERPFLRESGASSWLTFNEAWQSSQALAQGLAKLGVAQGDYVPLMLPNGAAFVLAWFAVNLRGAAYVGVNTSLVGDLLASQLAIGRARLWIVHADYLPLLENLPAVLRATVQTLVVVGLGEDQDLAGWAAVVRFETLFKQSGADPSAECGFLDICSVGFTSGTTGPSKGVMSPHGHAVATALTWTHVLGLGPEDTIYTPLPLFHGMSSRMGMLPALLTGCRIVIGRRFSGTRFWAEAVEAEATVAQLLFSIPPVLLAQPPGQQDRAHRVTRMFNAHYSAEFEARFGARLLECFAMSEIGMVTASPLAERRPGSAGRVHPDWDVAIVDKDGFPVPDGEAGELVCRPRKPGIMMRGYLHQPERTVEATHDLWFRSGDIARRDADGYLWFIDRAKERIRRRGENISSAEIEEAVRRYPEVGDVAAVAYPAREGEDDIRLLVVPRVGCAISPPALHGWMQANLPRFMVARYVEVVPGLPYTATNKVEKARLITAGLGPDAWDAEQAGLVR